MANLGYLLLAFSVPAVVVAQPHPNGQDLSSQLQTGAVLPKIVAQKMPSQSYALYLPTTYTPEKRWPIVYVFDPAARGLLPTELMKDAAEEYGYIVATSWNSRNGPFQPDAEAGQAMWVDTHARLTIDDTRVYFAGFSGGARVAAQLAILCKCVSAIFLSGAGFPTGTPPSPGNTFPVFLTAGFTDFNYKELVQLDQHLESLRYPHFLRRFDGQHQWAPSKIWPEAFAWADLLAISSKRKPRNESFVSAQLAKFTNVAETFEQEDEPYFAWQTFRQTIAAFNGLIDTSNLQRRVALLDRIPEVAAGKKREKDEFDQQEHLEEAIFELSERLRNTSANRADAQEQASAQIGLLRDRALHEKHPDKKRVLERARAGVFAYLMEAGEPMINSKEADLARIFLELAVQARPESAWPHVSLARCQMKLGDKKAALRSLKRAREAGLSPQDLVDLIHSTPEFAVLTSEVPYKLLTEGATTDSSPRQ